MGPPCKYAVIVKQNRVITRDNSKLQFSWRHSPLKTQTSIVLSGCQTATKVVSFYFGGARSKGFATLRNVSKLQFFDKIGQAKSVGFRFYSAI